MAKVWVWDENLIQKASLLRAIEALRGHEVNGCSTLDDAIRLCRSGQVDILLIDTLLHGQTWGLEMVDVLRRYAVRVGNDLHPHIGLLIGEERTTYLSATAFRMHIALIRKDDWPELTYWLNIFDEMVIQDQQDELQVSIFHT